MKSKTIKGFTSILGMLAVWVLLGPASLTWAHNGEVALGYPVEGIVIDGDLSDWPDDLPRYPVTRTESGVPPGGPLDLSASFHRINYLSIFFR